MNIKSPTPAPSGMATYGIITLPDLVEKLLALEVGGSLVYHTGFIAHERAKSHHIRKALDRVVLFVQILSSAELIFPYQQKVVEGTYRYGLKVLKELPPVINIVATDIDTRARFKDRWFVDTKLSQVKANMV